MNPKTILGLGIAWMLLVSLIYIGAIGLMLFVAIQILQWTGVL